MESEPRACRAEELPALVELVNRVFRAGGSGNMQAEYPLVFDSNALEGMRVISAGGVPVAHVGVCIRDASLLGIRLRVASIGAVCTDPDHRGGGYASALMADARRFARRQGAPLMLISGGRGLYHRLGYVTVGRFHRYRLEVDALSGTTAPGVEVTEHRPEELAQISAHYQAEPIRFLRPATDWQRLLQAGMLMNARADLLAVRQGGHLVAYLGIQRPADDAASGERMVRVQEIAGSRGAIIASLSGVLERYGATGISLVVQPSDQEFAFQARRHGWTPTTVSFPGTLGVIDPPALLESLWPLLSERTAQSGLGFSASEDGARFTLGADCFEIAAPGPLAALLFGGETEEAREVPLCSGSLGEVLGAALPLPLLWYGYNYV